MLYIFSSCREKQNPVIQTPYFLKIIGTFSWTCKTTIVTSFSTFFLFIVQKYIWFLTPRNVVNCKKCSSILWHNTWACSYKNELLCSPQFKHSAQHFYQNCSKCGSSIFMLTRNKHVQGRCVLDFPQAMIFNPLKMYSLSFPSIHSQLILPWHFAFLWCHMPISGNHHANDKNLNNLLHPKNCNPCCMALSYNCTTARLFLLI